MQNIKLSIDKAFGFVSEQAVAGYKAQIAEANAALHMEPEKEVTF